MRSLNFLEFVNQRRIIVVGFVFLLLGLLLLIGGFVNHWLLVTGYQSNSWLNELLEQNYSNFSSEFISIGITVLVINALVEKESRKREWERLVINMSSPDNGIAISAVKELKVLGLLTNGFLFGRQFDYANLKNAFLHEADLGLCSFFKCNFSGAILSDAKLRGVGFSNSDLSKTHLLRVIAEEAYFHTVRLNGADFEDAVLSKAVFEECDLSGANVTDRQLKKTSSLRGSIMPSGVKYNGRFNLRADLFNFKWMKEQGDFEEIHEFFGVPKEVYERGQYWKDTLKTRIKDQLDPEKITLAREHPDGEDLYPPGD